jgi:hypothetical protein
MYHSDTTAANDEVCALQLQLKLVLYVIGGEASDLSLFLMEL